MYPDKPSFKDRSLERNISSHEELEPREILIKHKILYHGSAISGIEMFTLAEEDTVGHGVYFVDDPHAAAGYARRRARHRGVESPVLYEAELTNARLANLDNEGMLREVMRGFAGRLMEIRESPKDLPWYRILAIDKALDAISRGVERGSVREVVFSHGNLFTEYLKSLGYDGLKTTEGGEGEDVGVHETYLVFDPERIRITGELNL